MKLAAQGADHATERRHDERLAVGLGGVLAGADLNERDHESYNQFLDDEAWGLVEVLERDFLAVEVAEA